MSSPTVVIVTTLGSAACAIGAKLTGSRRTLTEPAAGGRRRPRPGRRSATGVAPGGIATPASSLSGRAGGIRTPAGEKARRAPKMRARGITLIFDRST